MNRKNKTDGLLPLVIFIALITLISFLGRLFWIFDLASHFHVQIFQVCLVLIAVSIWRRKKKQAVTLVVLACLNYVFVLPFYFGKPASAGAPTVRAMLINLNASNGNSEQVTAAVQQAAPDLLLLEEVTPKWADALSRLGYPYQVSEVRNDPFGIMLLSKIPLSHTNVVQIGDAGVPSILATAHLPQGEITLLGTHPVPPISARFSKHRNTQLAALPAVVREQKHPVLLIGDLNVSPWSPYFTRLLKESGLKNSMKGFGFQSTWPAGNRFLRIPIDQILHSPGITIHRRAVGSDIGSDHLPVIVEFSLR